MARWAQAGRGATQGCGDETGRGVWKASGLLSASIGRPLGLGDPGGALGQLRARLVRLLRGGGGLDALLLQLPHQQLVAVLRLAEVVGRGAEVEGRRARDAG